MSKYKIRNRKRKLGYGGNMYAPNEIGAGLNPNSTSNIVFEESDPRLQEARMLGFEEEKEKLMEQSITASEELKQQKIKDKASIEADKAQSDATYGAVESGISSGLKLLEAGNNAASGAKTAGSAAGVNVGFVSKNANRLAKRSAKALSRGNYGKAARLTTKSQNAARIGKTAGDAGNLGASIGKWASSANGIGTIASAVGKGVSHLSDDKDATKWNAGEVTGDLLSSTGQGVAWGSMLGPIGSIVGGVAGAGYGLAKGLTQRNKARKSKREFENKRNTAIRKSNNEALENYSSQFSRARAGELKGKTYSGYNLGRNTVAKYGGLKKYI